MSLGQDDSELTESTRLVKLKNTNVESKQSHIGYYNTGKHQEELEKRHYDIECHPEKFEKSCVSQLAPNNATDTAQNSSSIFHRLKRLLSGVPRKKILVLFLCALANFMSSCAFSLIAPFFPLEARKKGVDLIAVGFVFSLYQLGGMMTSPFIGNYLNRIGAKFVYISGLFIVSTALACFGVLNRGPDGTIFLVMCIVCRVVESVGAAAYTTASIAIVSTEFPDNIGLVISIVNMGNNLGLLIGPVIGGALYQIGGFGLPFYVIAGLGLLDAVFIYFFLPKSENVEHKRQKSIFRLMRNARILVPMVCVGVGIGGIGIFDATFSTHLEPFKLSATVVGLFYGNATLLYALASPVWGCLSDRVKRKEILLMVALSIFGLGFFISGPSPLLPFIPFELWALGLGFALLGCSLGGITVTSLAFMTEGAYDLGYPKNLDTNGIISGLYYSAYSTGGFAGPMIGSIIIQNYGFPDGYTSFGLLCLSVMLFVLGYFLIRLFRRPQNYDTL